MQDVNSCLLSLFACQDDAMEVHGAVQWLMKAYEDYRNRVVNKRIGYKAFMEEFHVRLSMPIFLGDDATYSDLLQEATDRDKVKHILENKKFTEDNFTSLSFQEADAIKMIVKYNAIGTKDVTNVPCEVVPFSDYPSKAKKGIADVIRKHKLLSPSITTEDLELLLCTGNPSCQYMIPPYSKNKDLGLVINILIEAGALTRHWASIICKYGMLLTSNGSEMQRKNINAAVHSHDNYKSIYLDDKQREIEYDIMKVLAQVPSAVKNLRK